MPGSEAAKEAAGRRAAEEVRDGMALGLGTGSTFHYVLVRLGERIRAEGLRVCGVATSRDTAEKADRLGLPLVELNDQDRLDLYLDGADEVDPRLRLIKGAGAALLKEKVVAAASRRRVIVVDGGKIVRRLGERAPVPIEVVPFALRAVRDALARLGGMAEVRAGAGRGHFRTESGNEILDCRFAGGIGDPERLDRELSAIPGIVEHGLFLGLADRVYVGDAAGGVEVLEPPGGGTVRRDPGRSC